MKDDAPHALTQTQSNSQKEAENTLTIITTGQWSSDRLSQTFLKFQIRRQELERVHSHLSLGCGDGWLPWISIYCSSKGGRLKISLLLLFTLIVVFFLIQLLHIMALHNWSSVPISPSPVFCAAPTTCMSCLIASINRLFGLSVLLPGGSVTSIVHTGWV